MGAVISGAAADVAAHRGVDVLIGLLMVFCEQRGGRHDLARLAVAALGNVCCVPGRLFPESPSIVVISFPSMAETGVTQDRVGAPSK
jgi:hypothetical protein